MAEERLVPAADIHFLEAAGAKGRLMVVQQAANATGGGGVTPAGAGGAAAGNIQGALLGPIIC